MAVLLTGTGGIFTRLGRIFFGIESANIYSGSTVITGGELKPLETTFTDIMAQYASALQSLTDGLASVISGQRSSMGAIKTGLAQLAINTVIAQVNADVLLTDNSLFGALRELIDQMIGSGSIYNPDNDVDANAVTAGTVTAYTTPANTGNGTFGVSVVNPVGRNCNHSFAETLEFTCTADVSSGATARSETFSYAGEVANPDTLDYLWPDGSGCSGTVTVIDCDLDNSGNLLKNSNFELQTNNVPDFWSLLVGTAGTTIITETSIVYRPGKSVEFVGDAGGTLTSIAYTITADNDLEPNKVYGVNCWMRKTAGIAAGVMAISLLNSGNTVITDDAGTANTVSVTATTLSDSAFTAVTGFFRTPKTLVKGVTEVQITVRVTTALTSGESVFVDDLSMCEATELYTAGPWVAGYAGATDFIRNDGFTSAIANDAGGEFMQWFERVFQMRALGLMLPFDTSGGETISDTLIS